MGGSSLNQTISGHFVVALDAGLKESGIQARAVMAECGIIKGVNGDIPERVSISSVERFLGRMIDVSGDDAWHLALAVRLQPHAFREIGMLAVASGTVREAMQLIAKYSRIVSPGQWFSFTELEGHSELRLHVPDIAPGAPASTIDMVFASMVQICKVITCQDLHPLAVEMTRPKPRNALAFSRYITERIFYESNSNVIMSRLEDLDVPIRFHNEEFLRAGAVHLDRRIDELAGGISVRLAALLRNGLQNGVVMDGRGAANMLGVSVRSMQRRLQEEETSFAKVVDSVRHEQALAWMRNGKHSFGDISDLLGFSNRSGFNQAFRRWTGLSPTSWKRSRGLKT